MSYYDGQWASEHARANASEPDGHDERMSEKHCGGVGRRGGVNLHTEASWGSRNKLV